jgi:hypothetical protein
MLCLLIGYLDRKLPVGTRQHCGRSGRNGLSLKADIATPVSDTRNPAEKGACSGGRTYRF